MIGKIIKNWIKESLNVPDGVDFSVDNASDFKFGEYSSNLALILAKQEKKNPKLLAEELVAILGSKKINEVEKVEVAGPGFINFYLTKEAIKNILLKTKTGADLPSGLKGKKYFIEHTQPNPFKEFHIGHLMNNAIGESISRIIKTNGAEVKTATYHGDVGLHVAKAVWWLSDKVSNNGNTQFTIRNEISVFGQAYALGNQAYELNDNIKKDILGVNKKIYQYDPNISYPTLSIEGFYKWGREKSLEYFENIYQRLDSHFDDHFFESESGEIGKNIVLQNLESDKPVFEIGENGAVIFRGENFSPKTHTRVFLNSDGLPTYEAKEVGLAKIKKDKFDYDLSLTITANEQDSFFDVVEVAIGEVMKDRKGKLKHLSHGMLKLSTGKMSSRTGNIVRAEDMIEDVKNKVLEKMKDRDFNDEKKKEVAEMVSIGAIKYSILKQSIGRDIVFDFEKSLSFEGDSGPYLQYSAVRANSILKKAGEFGLKSNDTVPDNWQTTNLEKELIKFYDFIERACGDFAPQYLVTYLVSLAGEFNSFYAKEKIVDEKDGTSPYKLFITEVFKETMQSGLWLLGIKTPEEM